MGRMPNSTFLIPKPSLCLSMRRAGPNTNRLQPSRESVRVLNVIDDARRHASDIVATARRFGLPPTKRSHWDLNAVSRVLTATASVIEQLSARTSCSRFCATNRRYYCASTTQAWTCWRHEHAKKNFRGPSVLARGHTEMPLRKRQLHSALMGVPGQTVCGRPERSSSV